MDEQKELIKNLLFSSTNMAAMTSRENHLLKLGLLTHNLGRDSCDEKECIIQGQICVMNDHHQAECKCREACPRSSHRDKVCGSDGITYPSRCVLDMTSCKLSSRDRIAMVSNGRCPGVFGYLSFICNDSFA